MQVCERLLCYGRAAEENTSVLWSNNFSASGTTRTNVLIMLPGRCCLRACLLSISHLMIRDDDVCLHY
jgi:NADH:ubiquinone oxidoreductase subunit E